MSLMVLGTASHVGKSVMVAAICRSLRRRGLPVAPFKAQNMSLNSYVTEQGDEIGIAQAFQAYAAGLAPVREMNPVLLKPKADSISQVVLMGRPYRDVPIGQYYLETDALLDQALGAYYFLEEQYGNVIVEGAGGAAEVNLYDRDIANIRLARALKIPIILVADIERGGVFAQVIGTLSLLPEDIRPLVQGIIINKFRGDPALFSDGVRFIEERSGLPVLGVVPTVPIAMPSEDSLSIEDKKAGEGPLRIAIIRLPHISNFTDFELLERYAPVDYVLPGRPLTGYSAIIIPGTKNTVDDLAVLKESGTAAEILAARQRGIPIIGICGGYQMLGLEIVDEGIESGVDSHPGLALLNVSTRFAVYDKTTRKVKARSASIPPILSSIGEVEGYEIHMGETIVHEEMPAFGDDGAVSRDGLVIGSYLHGLFLNPEVATALLEYLRNGAGFSGQAARSGLTQKKQDCPLSWEEAIDAFSRHVEGHVDMDMIISLVQRKKE
jgi:adenosylcobyric acid synthase